MARLRLLENFILMHTNTKWNTFKLAKKELYMVVHLGFSLSTK